ncbi:MAG: hypothetical protein JWQ09_5200 [Segetibacter sp.]|nr:hypothetical protein [Segetibacter sp.]
MKKLLVVLFASGAISLTASAQKLDASKVPASVKKTFAKQFPGAAGKWEIEKGNYEAGFNYQGNTMSALFEANGTMTESEIAIKESELPAPVTAYIKTHHNGAKIKEAAKITKAAGEINYEAEVTGKDLLFDANGNFLKAVKA